MSSPARGLRREPAAVADRALVAAYPVLTRLLGEETMAALARDLLIHHLPTRGDLACSAPSWPSGSPACPSWPTCPYLADVARLEWAVHRAHTAADPSEAPPDLQALAGDDPAALGGALRRRQRADRLGLAGAAAVAGPSGAARCRARAGGVRAALAAGEGSVVWVWRRGYASSWRRSRRANRLFTTSCWPAARSARRWRSALDRHPDFSFEHWLTRALREGWLAEIRHDTDPT
jgi:hypothetical protein